MKTIKDIAEELGISTHAIRFYEKKGMLTIPRNEQGNRIFDEETLDRLRAIVHYRNVGMTLEDINRVTAEFFNHALSTQILKETKEELELKIIELQATRDYLEEKIKIHQHLADLEAQGLDAKAQLEAYKALRKNLK